MKKAFLMLATACTLATAADAQKGSILTYGNLSWNTAKTGDTSLTTKSRSISVSPGIGYQFTDNWTAGIDFGFNHVSERDDVSGAPRIGANSTRIGGFIRHTWQLSNIFSVFLQGGVGYHTSVARFDGENVDGSRNNGMYAYLTPAIMVNVKNGFAFNLNFGRVNFETSKQEYTDFTNTNFGLDFGLNDITIGISKNFGGMNRHRAHAEPMSDTRRMDVSDDDDNDDDSKRGERRRRHRRNND